MSEIKPALSPEEWAEMAWDVDERPRGRDGYDWQEGENARIWTNNSASIIYVTDRNTSESEETERVVRIKGPEQRVALAALCLHGRITWEMVDAARGVAETWGAPDTESDTWERLKWLLNEREYGGTGAEATLRALADLLESLLPPREP